MKVANNGVVYATWMNKYDMVFSKSTNHGATWTAPIEVSGSPVGRQAVDRREPRRRARLHRVRHQLRRVGRGVAQLGRVVRARGEAQHRHRPLPLPERARGARRTAPPCCRRRTTPAAASRRAGRSTSRRGARRTAASSWTRTVLGQVFTGVNFETSSTTALASDGAGTLVALYTGATSLGGNGHIWTRRSTDGGVTWAPAVELGNGAANASFPAIAGGASGRVPHPLRATTGPARGTRGTARRPTAARRGAPRSTSPTPTRAPRTRPRPGSRRSTATTARSTSRTPGKTVAVWGEGASFSAGPGGIWFNRSL